MKKLVFVLFAVFVSVSVFGQGQEFSFQGLPWGSTREQVIEKFGRPIQQLDSIFFYNVSVSGYLSRLDIEFDNNGMCSASYNVGIYQRLSIDQLRTAFILILGQITEKYGTYHEIISSGPVILNNEEQELAWHFNNYHIIVNTIASNSNSLNVGYCSDLSWRAIEEEFTTQKMIRFPNGDL
jgi:hypothetical protein